jgi:hypothetical protein
MNKKEAEKLGWKITGSGNDVTAENERLIFMGSLDLVLRLIEDTSEPA